ncbi:ATP-binding protein [Fibrobacter succinogenes]|uniref:AAA family ATPase n=1 Tax=Fibrobacter succinogenes TaxID=833 RepID=UPI00156990B1|nr:ATP-binding protein [Fibrobacter succinogenes]
MADAFIYGSSVEGENFTDRETETKRLKANFEHGVNTLLISNRRIGKTSLVRHVKNLVNAKKVSVVYLDIFDCRSEYDFYNKLATAVLRQTASKMDVLLQNIKTFLGRVSPKIIMSPDPSMDFSLSLGITPKEYAPEQILNLAENIAQKQGKRIVVCIDEFQQIGEFPDSLTVQKRLRGAWQLQQNVSYCLFGSKKHLMTNMFQNKSMPFFQFGDAIFLGVIPVKKWVSFICEKFKKHGLSIHEDFAARISDEVEGYSSYVQQLAWLVMLKTESVVTKEIVDAAVNELIAQNAALFMQQTEGLTSYQMNMLRALASGVHDGFLSKEVMDEFRLGTKSNISKVKKILIDRDLVEVRENGLYISDPVFQMWFRKYCL